MAKMGTLSVLLLALSFAMYHTVLKPWPNSVFPFVVVYFFSISSLQHYKLLKALKKSARAFQTNYMIWLGVKFFLSLVFVVVFVLLNRSQALSFVLHFSFCYVVFTIYEAILTTKTLKLLQPKQKGTNHEPKTQLSHSDKFTG